MSDIILIDPSFYLTRYGQRMFDRYFNAIEAIWLNCCLRNQRRYADNMLWRSFGNDSYPHKLSDIDINLEFKLERWLAVAEDYRGIYRKVVEDHE